MTNSVDQPSDLAPLESLPRNDHRYLKSWVVLVSIWFFVAAVLGFNLIHQRRIVGDAERDRLGTQARVIEENLTRQIRGANAALAGIRYDLESGDRDTSQNVAPLRLKVLSDAMPGVRAILLMNALGTIIDADRKDLVGRNYSESQTFRVPAAGMDPTALYLSPPFKSPIGGFTVTLGKTMRDQNGLFSGIVIASLDPEYFDQLMGSVSYAPDMVASIVHGDGKVVVVQPPDAKLLAVNVDVPGSLFRRHKESGEADAIYEGKGGTARPAEDRMVATRTMQPRNLFMNRPLIISVSRLRSAVYAPWYAELRTTLVLAALTFVASVILLYYAQRRRMALAGIRASVRGIEEESAKRLEFGLKGADLGLLDIELDRDRLTVNRREAEMLGFSRKETVHSARTWQRMIHPDDWPMVRQHLADLIEGRSDAFKLEHRMMRRDGHVVWVFSQTRVMVRNPQGRATRILGTHLDVSARKAAEHELSQTLQRLELAMQCGSIGLMDWNVASDTLVLNKLGKQMLGVGDNELLTALQWRSLRHPDDAARAEAEIDKIRRQESTHYNFELRVRHVKGHYLWLYVRGEVVATDRDGAPARVMITYRDVSDRVAAEQELRAANEQLAKLSVEDPLTGIGNRRRFDLALAAEWPRAARHHQPIALLMIDIDYFKLYNDHYGHQGGDDCLRQIASILSGCVRRPDEMVARYGGEEFAVLIFGADLASAARLAERCLDKVRMAAIPHATSRIARQVSLSIGVHSLMPAPGISSSQLVKAADEALYFAKGNGRNQARVLPDSTAPQGVSVPTSTRD